MKARIKFQKYGSMKFIGHLDVMRYFQKVFRRAEIDNEYTKGFSPHQIMSFAAPLGVGLTSDGEYVDIQLLSSDSPKEMIDRINSAVTEGFRIIGFCPLLEREENQKTVTAMSLVASADYLVSLKDRYALGSLKTQEEFKNQFEQFLANNEIVIDKKTKTSEKAVDIRPMITLAAFDETEYKDKLQDLLKPRENITVDENSKELASDKDNVFLPKDSYLVETATVADQYENGIKIYLQLDTGSSVNLKPELVMEAFYDYLGIEFSKFAWQVHRIEVYARDVESGKLAALDQLDR